MKAKITKSDGSVVELEGTAEEIARVVAAPSIQFVPYYVPQPAPQPVAPQWPYPIGPYDPIVWYGNNAACAGGTVPNGWGGTFVLNAPPVGCVGALSS